MTPYTFFVAVFPSGVGGGIFSPLVLGRPLRVWTNRSVTRNASKSTLALNPSLPPYPFNVESGGMAVDYPHTPALARYLLIISIYLFPR